MKNGNGAAKDDAAKLKAYLGFSLRSGKIVLGADKIAETRRGVRLILADADMGKTALKRLTNPVRRSICTTGGWANCCRFPR